MLPRSVTHPALLAACALLALPAATLPSPRPNGALSRAASTVGYYRDPALHDTTLVFTAEGDLWSVGLEGGEARRLTTGRGEESHAAISPDGRTIAFSAQYEGPTEVYTMPIDGGLPVRRTWDGGPNIVAGWTPDGRVLYATGRQATRPAVELMALDTATHARTLVPLQDASDGSYDGATLFFTRYAFQGSHTRRYHGGTAQHLWKWRPGMPEAEPLTNGYAGTSKDPMVWHGRVYFLSDSSGTMNVWSMDESGAGLKQLTHHTDFDIQSAAMSDGRIVYQVGADLWTLDVRTGADARIPIRLASDFDQMRDHWVDTAMNWVSAAHLSPHGRRVVLTARGQVYVAPAQKDQGRLVRAEHASGVRYRVARFMPDGDTLVALSDASGEVELWTLPADGVGTPRQLTHHGTVLRWEAVPSPDGKLIASTDKNYRLWIYDVATHASTLVSTSRYRNYGDLAWSPDSRWLAYVGTEQGNGLSQVFVYDARGHGKTAVTTDRYESYAPAWSPDGKWLWLLSDRHFQSLVRSPWGARQPEPFFDRQTGIFAVALEPGARFPFAHADELQPAAPEHVGPAGARAPNGKRAPNGRHPTAAPRTAADSVHAVTIDTTGIRARLYQVPVTPGNYAGLTTDGERLYFVSSEPGRRGGALRVLPITRDKPEAKTLVDGVRDYELSLDRKKLLVVKGEELYVIPAGPRAPEKLAESKVDLSGWKLEIDPREEWAEMYREAWRLERDYFFDRGMRGLDWTSIERKYAPLAARVTDRAELSDVLGQMISELRALHMFVRGGDMREPVTPVEAASLGARLERDAKAGGYRVAEIYVTDPDRPEALSPLARPGVNVHDGDIIEQVNGVSVLDGPSLDALLRNQAGAQVRLRVRPASGGAARDVIVEPVTAREDADLRYSSWEYSRRRLVDSLSHGTIGYLHLRAMGANDIAQFERDYYPVFDRQGLIFDDRNNRGGNIDSWILEKLMRRAWMYWQARVGQPYWNMQEAFRGPMVVLVNAHTASDGEAFAYGFRKLGLGKVLGVRTWGGEIWLSSSNILVDHGIATAAEMGVYGPQGEWLIEGHGVDPDTVVDDTPHEAFEGQDAQLAAAVKMMMAEIRAHPNPVPPPPKYPRVGEP